MALQRSTSATDIVPAILSHGLSESLHVAKILEAYSSACLGPNGLLQAVQPSLHSAATSIGSGSQLLEGVSALGLRHSPIGIMMLHVVSAQSRDCGDGGLRALLLTCRLLRLVVGNGTTIGTNFESEAQSPRSLLTFPTACPLPDDEAVPLHIVEDAFSVALRWVVEYLDGADNPCRFNLQWSNPLPIAAVLRGVLWPKCSVTCRFTREECSHLCGVLLDCFISSLQDIARASLSHTDGVGLSPYIRYEIIQWEDPMVSQCLKHEILLDTPLPLGIELPSTKCTPNKQPSISSSSPSSARQSKVDRIPVVLYSVSLDSYETDLKVTKNTSQHETAEGFSHRREQFTFLHNLASGLVTTVMGATVKHHKSQDDNGLAKDANSFSSKQEDEQREAEPPEYRRRKCPYGIVISQRLIHPLIQGLLLDANIIPLQRISIRHLRAIRSLSGARVLSSPTIPQPMELGAIRSTVCTRELSGRVFLSLQACDPRSSTHARYPKSNQSWEWIKRRRKVSTAVLCASDRFAGEALRAAAESAIRVLKGLLDEPRVAPGGGFLSLCCASEVRRRAAVALKRMSSQDSRRPPSSLSGSPKASVTSATFCPSSTDSDRSSSSRVAPFPPIFSVPSPIHRHHLAKAWDWFARALEDLTEALDLSPDMSDSHGMKHNPSLKTRDGFPLHSSIPYIDRPDSVVAILKRENDYLAAKSNLHSSGGSIPIPMTFYGWSESVEYGFPDPGPRIVAQAIMQSTASGNGAAGGEELTLERLLTDAIVLDSVPVFRSMLTTAVETTLSVLRVRGTLITGD